MRSPLLNGTPLGQRDSLSAHAPETPVSTPAEYGPLFRQAYAALHGGRPNEPPPDSGRRPQESLEEFLARSRGEALDRLRARLEAAGPPQELRTAHNLLVRLLASAADADAALAAQVNAYSCGNFGESISHSDRLHTIVSESARLDRELIAALGEAERARAGTLEALGIEEIAPPP